MEPNPLLNTVWKTLSRAVHDIIVEFWLEDSKQIRNRAAISFTDTVDRFVRTESVQQPGVHTKTRTEFCKRQTPSMYVGEVQTTVDRKSVLPLRVVSNFRITPEMSKNLIRLPQNNFSPVRRNRLLSYEIGLERLI